MMSINITEQNNNVDTCVNCWATFLLSYNCKINRHYHLDFCLYSLELENSKSIRSYDILLGKVEQCKQIQQRFSDTHRGWHQKTVNRYYHKIEETEHVILVTICNWKKSLLRPFTETLNSIEVLLFQATSPNLDTSIIIYICIWYMLPFV